MVPPPEAIAMMPAIHSGDQALRIKRPHKCPRIGVTRLDCVQKHQVLPSLRTLVPRQILEGGSQPVLCAFLFRQHSDSLSSVCMLVAEWR